MSAPKKAVGKGMPHGKSWGDEEDDEIDHEVSISYAIWNTEIFAYLFYVNNIMLACHRFESPYFN
jgi:hypothetical protein